MRLGEWRGGLERVWRERREECVSENYKRE